MRDIVEQGVSRQGKDCEDIMIDKNERRNRLIEDFKKIFGDNNADAIKFAENFPDELLDKFEDMGFSSNKKIKVESNLEVRYVEN